MLLFSSILQRHIDNYFVLNQYLADWQRQNILNPIVLLSTMFKQSTVLAIPVTFTFVDYFHHVQRRQQELERQKLQAELTTLKNQIQPHFLFNTLNSLYSLIIKKSDTAVDVVLKLSELLRYVLYESENERIELVKEISFVNSYIDLERMRLGSTAKIDVVHAGSFNNTYIAPLLIIPFIENAIKHGITDTMEPVTIKINLSCDERNFHLIVENPVANNHIQIGIKNMGIGLQNVKKRLAILYPDRYILNTQRKQDSFLVDLSIKLS